jgi:hypothetical protein
MKRAYRLAVAIVAMGLLLVATAHADEPSSERGAYVAAVEPICEANSVANKRILRNARERARSKDPATMKRAGTQFIQASAAFAATVRKIAAVPRPAADDARLRRWFDQLDIVSANLRQLGKALKEGEKIRAAHEAIRVERSSNAANNVGFVFEFNYCRITPSRFS